MVLQYFLHVAVDAIDRPIFLSFKLFLVFVSRVTLDKLLYVVTDDDAND